MATTIETATGWQKAFAGALAKAAAKAGESLEGLAWEGCSLERTWGDLDGLVFFGGSEELSERAARFFQAWASRNLREMKVVGGYGAQAAIRYAGPMTFRRFENGARAWGKGEGGTTSGTVAVVETKKGHATAYVYYPCSE